jgi:anaerobic ribonucleoside-triphosphate reductase
MINKAFYELMLKGDADGRPFGYPIPTYNIHKRFDWDNPNNDLLFEMAGKYGYPYFANFINSEMDIGDTRSMCCRLSLSLTDLRRRNGGLFGSGDSTGSIGVVTINLPRLAYQNSENEKRFFKELSNVLTLAKESLEIKREWLQENIIDKRMIPAYNAYVGTLKNHFSTIGVIGMNEMCENFFGEGIDILSDEGKRLAIKVSNFIRDKLIEFQQETGNLWNYEATPAEGTAYRLAKKDTEEFDDIVTRGTKEAPYYTNSCHIAVGKVTGIKSTFDHQDDLQTLFTGGTVIHTFLDGSITGGQAKQIIKALCETYKTPYISLSPLNRYCKIHGYVEERLENCPQCGAELELYQRVTGYLRKVDLFNAGKKSEFKERVQLTIM